LFKIQRQRIDDELASKRNISDDERLKLEYLTRRCRSLEFALGFDEKHKQIQNKTNNLTLEIEKDNKSKLL
jgi:hypothetical protein